MKENTLFSPRRFALLLRREVIQNYKPFLIMTGALLGGLLFLLLVSFTAEGEEALKGLFPAFLWVGGLIYTSLVFKEAHSARQIHSWLMTPASRLEKYLLKLFRSTLGYFGVLVILMFTASVLNVLIYSLKFTDWVAPAVSPVVFNPFRSWVWINLGHYLIIQSVFFLGAIWFKKYNFIKTVLTLYILLIVFAVLTVGASYLAFWAPIRQAVTGNPAYFIEAGQMLAARFSRMNPWIITVLKVVYFGLIAPYFWFLSWIRMREVEVNDGV